MFAGVMALLTPLIYFKGPRRADDKPSNWFYMPETKDVPLEDIRYLFTLSVRRRNDAPRKISVWEVTQDP